MLLAVGFWRSAQAADGVIQTNRLLIIAPVAFKEALRPFLAHKQALLPAELVVLEDILKAGQGADDAEKLKRFLYQEWRAKGLGYVLLAGDVDQLPVRYMVLDRVTTAAFDYSFYPSDLYYADLAKPDGSFEDWNAQKESFHWGYYGEVRGEKNKAEPINFDAVDYRPDIAVGRWPVSTAVEVQNVVQKSIAYESRVLNEPGDSLRRAAFVVTGGWVDSRRQMDGLAASLEGQWLVEKQYYADRFQGNSPRTPNRETVKTLLNRGAGLVVHSGHGQPGEWEQCLSVNDLKDLTNSAALPIFVSAGCSTAYFAPLAPYDGYVDIDGVEHTGTYHKEVFNSPPPPPANYQRGRFNPTGLGEQILKHPVTGGIAYIGCNTGSQPCGLTLVDGFVNAVAGAKTPRLGDCWAKAVSYYYDKERLADLKPDSGWYPPSIFFQAMKFMLFGDPTLRMPMAAAH